MVSKHLRPGRFILLGALLGLTYAYTRPVRSVAEITLFFPADVSRPELRQSSEPREAIRDFRPNPRARVQEILLRKETIDKLCKQLEEGDLPDRVRLLREGCLLLDQRTLDVSMTGDHSLRIAVVSSEPPLAEELCRSLLRCVKEEIQRELTAKSQETILANQKLEAQLVFQEKLLFKRLWKEFSEEKPAKDTVDPMAQMELSEYERNLERFDLMIVEDFYQQVNNAVDAPGFAVLEPLHSRPQERHLDRFSMLGAGLGMALWIAFRILFGKGPELSGHKATT